MLTSNLSAKHLPELVMSSGLWLNTSGDHYYRDKDGNYFQRQPCDVYSFTQFQEMPKNVEGNTTLMKHLHRKSKLILGVFEVFIKTYQNAKHFSSTKTTMSYCRFHYKFSVKKRGHTT